MEIKDAIYGRRSVRKFLSKPVPREKLESVLKAGTYAPSAMNDQQRHDRPVAEGKLAVIDPAPQMKKLRLAEQSGGQLPLQGGTEIFTILCFGRIG